MGEKSLYNRRSVIASISALVLGGLAGLSSGDTSGAAAQETTEPLTETTTQTETETQAATQNIDLTVSDATVTTVDTGLGEEIIGEVTVTNEGTVQTDSFVLGLDWLDNSGEYIATTDVYGIFLDAGETWIARSPAWLDVENTGNIGSIEASITETDPWGELEPNPDGFELVESTVRASEEEVVVRGRITNNRQTTEFIEAAGKVYDADGTVLAMETTLEEVPSGDTWQFEMNPQTHGRDGQVDSATVIPYISTF